LLDQVHLSQEEDLLYQSVSEKTRQKRENGDREREEHTSPQIQTKDPKKTTKEIMEIEQKNSQL